MASCTAAGDDKGGSSKHVSNMVAVRGNPGVDKSCLTALCEQELEAFGKVRVQRQEAMHEYAGRVDALRERVKAHKGSTGLPFITISDAARATVDEVCSFTKAVGSEKGVFAKALNRRGWRAAGLAPNESFDVRHADGRLVARVLRDALSPEQAAAYALMKDAHVRTSVGWGFGCEADVTPDLKRLVGALQSNPKYAQALRIVEGFHVDAIHRSGSGSGLKVDYTNRDGKATKGWGIGNPFDRWAWEGAARASLQSIPEVGALLDTLERVYAEHAAPFLEQRGFPTDVRALLPCPNLL